MVTKARKIKLPDPNILLKLMGIFLVIDFFAFQKELSGIAICILIDIPLLLFAATNFIWAQRKEFPLNPSPYILDDGKKVFFAYVYCAMCIFFAILATVIFPLFYEAK
jgi:hypothetical protein